MNKTKIEWVKNPDGTQGYTWNPITGCLNGCEYCYARKLANGRLKSRYLANTNVVKYEHFELMRGVSGEPIPYEDPFYPRFWTEKWGEPLRGNRNGKGIFVCSMGELFGDWIPREWQDEIFHAIKLTPENRFYLLTKQPQNLIKFSPFPDNCYVGISATDTYNFDKGLDKLNHIEAKVKYISFEPLLERIKSITALKYNHIDGLIIGGLSGKDPFYPPWQWIGEIENAADRAGIPVFEKYNLRPQWANLPRQELPVC